MRSCLHVLVEVFDAIIWGDLPAGKKFTIHWHKDRGCDPDGGERINDRHVARAAKVAARAG